MKKITKSNLKEAIFLHKNGGFCGTDFEILCSKCPWDDECKDGKYMELTSTELKLLLETELNEFTAMDIVEVLL